MTSVVNTPESETLFPSHIPLSTAYSLDVGAEIDHRNKDGRFYSATIVMMKMVKTKWKIRYKELSNKDDVWSDWKKEIHRFVEAGSISGRKAHRFIELKKNDYVYIHPTQRNIGWRLAKITTLHKTCGQIQVKYQHCNQIFSYWVHLDNKQEIKYIPTRFIICGYIHILEEKHNLFIPIDMYQCIILFCGDDLYKSIILKPEISIKSSKYCNSESIKLNILKNDYDDDTIGYRILYKAKQFKMINDWNIIDVDNYEICKEFEYEIKGLEAGTDYVICVESKDKENIYITSSKINVMSWKFDVISNGYNKDCIGNDGKTFVTKRNRYVTASYSKGYNTGIHEFHIKCIGIIRFIAFSIVCGHIHTSKGWIFNHDDKHYYFDCDGIIYTDYDKKLMQTPKWREGDIISMILNCNEWNLCYKINHGRSYKINIEKNKTYYPSVSAHYKGLKVVIL